jgi:hypothetical protein
MIVIVPPLGVETGSPPPLAFEATTLEMPMGVEVLKVEGAMVKLATATTPFEIVLVLIPKTMQVRAPVPLQLTLLPAAIAALPAATETAEISVVE